MIAKLRPANRFPQFVHRPNAAGDRDEAIGQVSKTCLSLVHSRNDMQFGAAFVSDFGPNQRFGNDADNFAASLQCRIGNRAH